MAKVEKEISHAISQPVGQKIESDKYFSFARGALLLLLALVISVVGWYAVTKYYLRGQLDSNRVNEQLKYYQQKVQAQPNNAEYRVGLGHTYLLKGENELAIKEFNQALEIDGDYYDAYYNLGVVYTAEERFNDALEVFQKTIELNPKEYKGYMQQGIAYRKLEMYDEAIEALNKADRLAPGNADIIYQLGVVVESMGKAEDAIKIYKEALNYDPLFKDAAEAVNRLEQK